MQLVTDEIRAQLDANGKAREAHYETSEAIYDPEPVCKFFNPAGPGVWLIAWADPGDPDHLFGLCELSEPELGFVSLRQLETTAVPFGLGIERDILWTPHGTLMQYAEKARETGDIRSADSALYRTWFRALPGKERAEMAGDPWPCAKCGEADCPSLGQYGGIDCEGKSTRGAA